jgi:hypothetical protein
MPKSTRAQQVLNVTKIVIYFHVLCDDDVSCVRYCASLAMSDFGQFSLDVGIHLKLGIKTIQIFVEHEIWPETTNLCGTE